MRVGRWSFQHCLSVPIRWIIQPISQANDFYWKLWNRHIRSKKLVEDLDDETVKKKKKMGLFKKILFSFVVLLVIHQNGQSDAARILGLFPLHGKSHYIMCETLMRGLAARGHQVDVVSHFPLKNPPSNYHHISIAGSLPPVINNLTLQEAETFTGGTSLEKFFNQAGNQFCELLDLPQFRNIIENPPNDPPYDVVIYELFIADCYLAFGRHLKVPMVGVVTSKLFDWMNLPMGNPQSPAFVPSIFSAFSQRMTFTERLLNTLISGTIKAQYWYYIPTQLKYVEKHFGIKVSSITELYKDIAVMLVNTHPSFDFVKPTTPGIIEVGGLHVTDGDQDLTPEVKKWLDNSKNGCIYFSFGSMLKIESFPTQTVKAFYTAFERIAPVRVLMKIAKTEELPPGLPKNVMTSAWLPQTRVLQHKNIKAFVTHGGLMSTQESVTYGVPMVHVPIFGDQHLNSRLCEKRNISISVTYRTVTADEFTNALNTILKDPTYSKNAKQLSKHFVDRPMSAIDTAVFWVEYVIRHGNVLRSPADELYWWQIELLDVYAVIISIVLLFLYIIKRMVGFVICRLCSKSDKQEITASKSKKNK